MSRQRRSRRARPVERAAARVTAPETDAPATEAPTTAARASDVAPAATGRAWLERLFIPAALLILAVAAALRLPELALNPFHHDEGVNGWFTTNLVRQGSWTYDPANYHGPSLYYFALVSEIVFGLTTEAMRLVPVIFGLLVVAGTFALRPLLGSIAVLTAGALLAVSPGMVYVSRYFIHEMLLVAFTLGLVASALLWLHTHRPVFAILAAASLAFMAATKEVWWVTVGVLVIAAVSSGVYVNLRAGRPLFEGVFGAPQRPAARTKKPQKSVWIDGVEYRATDTSAARTRAPAMGIPGITTELVAAAVIVFLCIYVLLFTSFFTNFPRGLGDSISGLFHWLETGGETQVQPVYQYLLWMLRGDGAVLVLGTVGGLIAALRGRDRLAVFIGLWALGTTLAYSYPQYKTPWIAVNMLLPLALLGGLAIRELATERRVWLAAPALLVIGLGWSAYQAVDLNFRNYDADNEAYPYVFVHSTRETFDLLDEIEARSAELGTGDDTGVSVVSVEYWPLPWYLRNNQNVAFWGRIPETPPDQPLLIANANQAAELEPFIGSYTKIGTYTLRPGVELELYIRNDLAGG